MSLQYLDFDYSEDEHGHGCFEAMASVSAQRVAAVREEIARVLDWAFENFPDLRAPLEEGGEWDYQLESQQEWTVPEALRYDEVTGKFSAQPGAPGGLRHVLTLVLSGSAQFCVTFGQRFGLA